MRVDQTHISVLHQTRHLKSENGNVVWFILCQRSISIRKLKFEKVKKDKEINVSNNFYDSFGLDKVLTTMKNAQRTTDAR